jgi:hypothetical protein
MVSLFAIVIVMAWICGSAGAWDERVIPGWQDPEGMEISGNHLVVTEIDREIDRPRTGTGDYFLGPNVYNIHLVSLPSGDDNMITHQADPDEPDIDGDRMVWRNGSSLFIYTISSGTIAPFTTSDEHTLHPKISGDCIAWEMVGDYTEQKEPGSNAFTIIFHSLPVLEVRCSGGGTKIELPLFFQMPSRIIAFDGSRLAWNDIIDGTSQIFFHDLQTGSTRQISNGKMDQLDPDVAVDRVVWREGGSQGDVIEYDIQSGTSTSLTSSQNRETHPHVAGDRTIWVEEMPAGETLWLADKGGGSPQQVIQVAGAVSGWGIPVVALSPEYLAFMAYNQSSFPLFDLHVIALNPSSPTTGPTGTMTRGTDAQDTADGSAIPGIPGFTVPAALAGVGVVIIIAGRGSRCG